MIRIRPAIAKDASAMLDIYAPFVRDTSITFETGVPTEAAFADRILHYLREWPWLAAEDEGKLAGYAYASRYRERAGYQWSVECSVYVHPTFLRNGIAAKLYQALFEILRLQGYRNVYAVINLPNEPSVHFHESCGFRWFASYENVGYKLGHWKTVGWWRLILNDFGPEPDPPTSFRDLDVGQVSELLKSFSGEKDPK